MEYLLQRLCEKNDEIDELKRLVAKLREDMYTAHKKLCSYKLEMDAIIEVLHANDIEICSKSR